MPELHIHLLGDFRLATGASLVSNVNAPRLRSLLAYLVLHHDAPQARHHLAFLLWPDTTDAQARTNLRQLVHGLKQILPEAGHFVLTSAQTLQWRPDAPFRLDVSEFEEALTGADAAEQHSDPHALRVALEQAIAFYHGDLLPSCYDDWILPERERLRQAFTGALERLLLLLERQGDPRAAMACAQRLLRHDPLREDTYRALMRLSAACGDRAGALRVYHTCATVLERELGVEPSAATREAYEHLVRGEAPARPVMPSPKAPTNLPVPLTSFVGRQAQMAEITHLLQTTRLLTLTGPGGCGKTRLALEVATNLLSEYADGVWLVELAPLADPTLVPQTVAATLGVREQPGRPILGALLDYVRTKTFLLILDNCEHLIETCAQTAEALLRVAPGLTILASSRESFGIAGETSYRVPSLSLPDPRQLHDLDALAQNDCVRLFVDRASAAYPPFRLTAKNAHAVAQIGLRLDGIPLAIELAAARTKVFPPEQIAARLSDRFRLLTGGSRTALERHQTLQALIDWSHQLLSEAERVLLHRLSVFAGGWSFEAAQAVCGDGLVDGVLETLARLADKSMVVVEEPIAAGEGRYRLLEIIRQYARDKLLASGEAEAVRDRHLEFFLREAEEVEPKLRGAEQVAWLERVETGYDNLRTALAWSLERGKCESALRLAGALYYFWELRGYWSEGHRWLDEALAQASREPSGRVAAGDPSLPARAQAGRLAKALYAAGGLHFLTVDLEGARTMLEESLRLWRELGDKWWMAAALELLGLLSLFEDDLQTARARWEEGVSLGRAVEDRWPLALCLIRLASPLMRMDVAAALRILEEGVPLARRLGDKSLLSLGLLQLVSTYLVAGNLTSAAPVAEEALAEARATGGNQFVLSSLLALVAITGLQGDPAKANGYGSELVAIARETGNPLAVLLALVARGMVASISGQPGRAVSLLMAVESWARQRGIKLNLWGGSLAMVHNRFLEMARAQLDPATFEAAWVEGQQMTMEQALTLAMEDESEDSQLPEAGLGLGSN